VTAPPAVLVMAAAARPAPELAEALGAPRAAELEQLLLTRAQRWACELSPGAVHVAGELEMLADAVARVGAGAGGEALLVIWPALPSWRPEHAEAVLDDLASGCGASVGPVFDGGLYMLAAARALPSLFALPAETWDSPNAMGRVLAAINEAGVPVGLLRAERGLRRMGDVRAALADPLLDHELRTLLEPVSR
jgi:glycosyltransferase A (GT-A) superfamily protein (DUF2064 family)